MTRDAKYNMEINRIKGRVDYLEKQNIKLLEHINFLKKNGYTYDQVTSHMLLCDRCGASLIGEVKKDRENKGESS